MWGAIELSDVHDIALVLENSGFVVIYVEVIGGGEDSHNRWEAGALRFTVHSVSMIKLNDK